MDFDPNADYRMYHGDKVPGFPCHPHRGFETITSTIEGIIDHSDSHGNGGRYGEGDLQWMHAGAGVVHGEMFPLLHKNKENALRFFQIWLNLPARKKMTKPDFAMHWANEILKVDTAGGAKVTVWAGEFNGQRTSCAAPVDSYAADADNDVSILHIEVGSGQSIEVDAAKSGAKASRFLYLVEGDKATVGGRQVQGPSKGTATLIEVDAAQAVSLEATGSKTCEFLLLQGIPIDEPVAQHGPFVMNTQNEIRQAMLDYQQTRFGGWPWPKETVVFPRTKGRFALFDGVETSPPDSNILEE
jgi:redox-sensitive bicupin YhaK (pirin superfamily)